MKLPIDYANDRSSDKNGTQPFNLLEDIGMEMRMSVEKAKQRALELMGRGYH